MAVPSPSAAVPPPPGDDSRAALPDPREVRLLEVLNGYGRVAVAFSGGVDSSLVAWAAHAAAPSAVAVTAVSPSLAEGELDTARAVAAHIGIPHIAIRTEEFSRPEYVRNAGDRCYHCKTELYEHLIGLRERLGVDVVANGANLDDLGDYRPGMDAAREHGVRSPLIEAQLTKSDVRDIARRRGLPVWDKPAAPCLSSRIAYGVEVTPERVRRIDAAEAFLRSRFGLRELRVRLEANDLARIEVPLGDLPPLMAGESPAAIAAEFRGLGFRRVTIDLEGFRSGNLNDALPLTQLTPLAGDR
ncbi:MAG: ATP-dependent sacrificial sulfur transferase LarE [Planctomyces sp.]|nr:ATP-dependent sacrificial sulfur transferase LarE [Planctomyces sp.]